MGRLWRGQENRWSSFGLRPGVRLHIEAQRGSCVETAATRLEELTGDGLHILPLVRGRERTRIEPAARLHVMYEHDDKRYHFHSSWLGTEASGELHLIALPAHIEPFERRRWFRLITFIRPVAVFRAGVAGPRAMQPGGLLLDADIVDLGEGGMCLSSRHSARAGEVLGVHASLQECGYLKSRVKVVGVERPVGGNRSYRLHCAFTEFDESERERVARFVLWHQLEMRKRGRL